jgi:type II secretory pathway component PulF
MKAMRTYDYAATMSNGERTSGHLEADDLEAARQTLSNRGLRAIELTLRSVDEVSATLGDDQSALFVHAVGAAAASRVPLEVTLSALAEERDDPHLAEVARRLSERLHQGASIAEAVATVDHALPAEVLGVLRAGVESGDLAGAVEQFAQQRIAAQRIKRQIRSAIAYPTMILSILVPIALFLSLYVIPMFGALYRDFDMDLPVLTEWVLRVARQMPGLISVLVLILIGLPLVLRFVGGRWVLHRVRSATPLLGRLWMWSGQREFTVLLASFLDLRLPMTDAVAYTSEVLGDRSMSRACRRLHERLQTGESLSECLSQSIHFDRTLVALTSWGESHGLLPQSLRIATEVFDDRIIQRTALVRRLLPPLTMVVVAILAFLVVASLMIPLVKLIEGLSR